MKKGLRKALACSLGLLLSVAWGTAQQTATAQTYPKEIRGYKIEHARVEIRRKDDGEAKKNTEGEADALVQFGEPRVARVTPLGITLEVPITIAAVKQGGHVDFLTFEEMTVNGTPVSLDEYDHPFELPNKNSLTLPEPIRLFISAPRVILGALDEWNNSKEMWPVTGRVYVFGRFKKFLFQFKRAVPIELSLSLSNPLRVGKQPIESGSNQ